jgi:hypothetical protein
MADMKRQNPRVRRIAFIFFFVIFLLTSGFFLYNRDRPAPIPLKRELFDGVTYKRKVQYLPRAMVAHILVINTKANGLGFFVTPPDEHWKDLEHPVSARTTSAFLEEFDLKIAVNGDGFHPWWSRGPLDYYPHEGDGVTPNGIAASRGKLYSTGMITEDFDPIPTLYISRRNELVFNRPPSRIFNAISGDRMLVVGGQIVEGLDDSQFHPRTALGINKNGRWLYIVVVDGRQPFYSEGATYQELAQILLDLGANYAMALDGGGSSVLVMAGEDGKPVVLNSPIDLYIPGRQRPVANHLGIYLIKE